MELRSRLKILLKNAGIVRVSAGPIGLMDKEVVEVEHFDACRNAVLDRVEMHEVRGVVGQEERLGAVEPYRFDCFLRVKIEPTFIFTFLRFNGAEPLSSRRANSLSL